MTGATLATMGTAGRDLPRTVRAVGETCTVARAWPAGGDLLRLEGHDEVGRVRAGRLHLGPAGDHRAELTPHGTDTRLPALAGVAEGGEIVVHRLGRRAVVRHPDRYLKVVRPGRGAELLTRHRAGTALARAAGFETPVATAGGEGLMAMSVLPGTSLHQAGADADDAAWARAWDLFAASWERFARPADAPLPVRTAPDEAATVATWVDRAVGHSVLTDPGGGLRALAVRVQDALVEGTSDPYVVAHRDLHDKQVLVTGTRAGLLDLDTVALAEPALDLANLAVHARLREAQGIWSPDRAAVAGATVGALAASAGVRPDRFAAYAAATAIRIACLYAYRPRWQALARRWTESLIDESPLIRRSSPAHPPRRG